MGTDARATARAILTQTERDVSTTPSGSRFEFVVMASARAKQLLEGCRPRIDGEHKTARTALREVKTGALWTSDDGKGREEGQ